MLSFRDISIRHKLIWLSVLASGSALILACAAFVAYEVQTFREAMVKTISTQAKIVGYNSAAAILFNDSKAATEILTALNAEPDIISAAVYGSAGTVFARYRRDGSAATEDTSLPGFVAKPTDGHRFEWTYLELSQRIIFHDKPIGVVTIRASLKAIKVRLVQYVGIAALVMLLSTVGSILVSLWFQRRISQPILKLAATAESVSRHKDFSIRARGDSRDEVGLLVETFNEMLARIQEQNNQLQKARDELEQRVIERTVELEAANKELEAFSYSVSHDLRAPLRSIDGFSQSLLEDYADKLDGQGQDDLQRVRSASQRMGQLIDDMLELSRVTRSEIQRQAIDLSSLARTVAAELQNSEPQREVEFIVAEGVTVKCDPRLLRLVLENLLGNAWKFTAKHRRARIEFGVTQSNGKPAYFVRDDGAGFDMAYAGKLFGAFQRLHAMTEFKGTGIGLATVQRIIRRHGGHVWAEGKLEQGATFYFTLQLQD
jgi:signal transduction histidine kinase